MLAGVPLMKACLIVDASYLQVREYIPADFRTLRGRKPKPKKWHNGLLEEVEAVYRDNNVPLATICELYGVSPRSLYNQAAAHDWPKRRRGPRPMGPRPLTRKEHTYLKACRNEGMSKEAALREIFSHG
jgi:hypothetical protein